MNQQQKFWIKEARDILLLIVAGFLMTLFFYRQTTSSFSIYLLVSFYTACMWIFLWKGNNLLTHIIDQYVSWIKEPLKRFFIGITGTTIYSVGIVYLLVFAFEYFSDISFGDTSGMVVIALMITFIISLFMHGREFYFNWKQTLLQAEQLQKENIQAQYNNLKSQVNPHFLFNSLNALTNLVYEDQDKAAKFIKQLSEVYRYVLDTRDQEIVSIQEELNFLNAYLFLQQIRFEKNLITKIELNGLAANVAPLSIQMLFENAIKHNVISKESPLEIRLYRDTDFLIVENTLQPKTISLEDSRGMGLENIVNRYSFLSDKKVIIEKDTQTFRVRIPIIPTDQHSR